MPKHSPLLYRVEVVPLTPLFGRRDPRFSYASREPVAPGSLVSISFGRRTLTGVTLTSDRLPGPMPTWMKFIGPTILAGWLTPAQITLAWELSDRLYTPLGIVFKLFFPLQHKPREPKTGPPSIATTQKNNSRQKRKKVSPSWSTVMEGVSSETQLFERLIKFGNKALKEKKLLCILVPEILAAEWYAQKIQRALPEAIVSCLTSQRTSKEQYLIFQAIRTGALDIVIGTRQTVFAPFIDLSAIIIIDAEKQLSYTQWEMAPRYDAVEIAESLARQRAIPFVCLSVAPGIAYFLPETQSRGTPFTFTKEKTLKPIDLRRTSPRNGTPQPLSPDLLEALRATNTTQESTLILVQQRGLARFSLCAKCQMPLRCPHCATALSEAVGGHFRCLSCGYQTPLFPSCVQCGHMHFKSFGAGTQSIVRALERSGFPQRILTIDRDTQTKKSNFQTLAKALTQLDEKPAIIVATYESAYSLPFPPLGLIALIEPDQGLFYPDFQSEERLWRELRRFGGKLKRGGSLLIQTFEPESAFWTTWIKQSLTKTAAELLEERRLLHYPPYYRLIQLECYPTKEHSSAFIAERTETQLQALKLSLVEILPKYLPFNKKNRYHILIRLPRDLHLPEELHHFLGTLDHSVHVTLNPLSLHS